jgi:carboxylate-amine ligase
MVRPLGIEEELLLFSPETREAVPAAPQVIKRFHEHGPGREPAGGASDELDHELFRHQLEIRTDPTTDAGDAFAQLVAARRNAGMAARAAGLAIGVSGIAPLGTDQSLVSADDRYLDMLHTFGEVARAGGTCGMHVHVEIQSPEEGIGVIDRVAPWLPVLVALSANSPFADRRDTGYASWRSQVWARWPSAGPTEQFGSLEGYREVSRMLLESGAARDDGMLYFDARLSAAHPTVEVRVCDVCTDPADAVVVAVLVRALVETSATAWAEGRPAPPWRAEALRAAHWRASRFGLSETLVHPVLRELRPAREVLDALVAAVEPALADAGDLDRVMRRFDRVLHENGAARQRAAYERTGTVEGVVDDLIARTGQSWDARDTVAERA